MNFLHSIVLDIIFFLLFILHIDNLFNGAPKSSITCFGKHKGLLCVANKAEYIKEQQFDFIRQTGIKNKPNIEE